MSKLKYKVGDRVKIKSLNWYNENKDEFGIVECGKQIFIYPMTKLCGKTVTIRCVNAKDCYYVISGDDGYNSWSDEMFEGLVEEKIKPKFKVGDKVKDKNNRVWFIVRVSETFFDISSISIPNAQGYFVPIEDQDDYELVPQCFSNDI